MTSNGLAHLRLPIPLRLLIAALAIVAIAPCARAQGKAKHTVIVVMDGLRPDTVTEANMPTLAALAKRGTFFGKHHPVFVSSTDVNGTALATGMTPGRSGMMANRLYRPDFELLRPVDARSPWAIWQGDKANGEVWIHSPTLPELARASGLTTAVAGTKSVALLWDRSLKNRVVRQPTVFDGRSIPSATLDNVIPDMGPLPPGVDWAFFGNEVQDAWTTRVLTRKLWADGVPALSVLWLSEPDFSQHGTGMGSANSLAALHSSDTRLAGVLAALKAKQVDEQTNVLVVSDHGFSTISRGVDVAERLRSKGLRAEGEFHEAPRQGDIMVAGLGGAVSLYVIGGDMDVRRKLLDYLQGCSWAGVIFTRDGAEGTFKMSDAGIDTPTGPDVLVAMRWDAELGKQGVAGRVVAEGGMKEGQGMHGSLSPYDMHNTLIAAGPDFKRGRINEIPSANSDVSPTIAHLMGIKTDQPMQGRILFEALVGHPEPEESPQTTTLRAQRVNGEKTWMQYMRYTTFAGQRYYDEGNTVDAPKE